MEEINIKKDENTKMDLNKKCFKFELAAKINIKKGYSNFIRKVIELPKDRIGVLFFEEIKDCLFCIYSLKTFAIITKFKGCYSDVAKMEDNNLILCDAYNIYNYELLNNEYKLLQKIQCYEKIEEKEYIDEYSRDSSTEIYSIYLLKSKDLIVCSYNEMKIYKKENGKYIYFKTLIGEYSVKEIFEINPNTIVLFMIEALGSDCIIKLHNFCLGLYNIQNDENKILVERRDFNDVIDSKKHFLKIGNHLIAEYSNYQDFFDIEQNMKLINEVKKLEPNIPFYHLMSELKNNFFLATKIDGTSFVYKYENKSLKEYQKFPFNLKKTKIIKLKNNKLIIYSQEDIKLINIFD